MTRDEAKHLLPIIKAFSEGKTIQRIEKYNGMDCAVDIKSADINFDSYPSEYYRIKPTPKYRPFKDAEECWNEMLKHQPVGWIKNRKGSYNCITCVNKESDEECVSFSGDECDFEYLFEDAKFYDGAPFGVKEESEG